MAWLRLDEDVLDDPRVAAATAEQGPLGIASWIYTLTSAKRQNRKGTVELSPIVMARSCGMTMEQAAGAITTLVNVGLVQIEPRPNTYIVPNWSQYQTDPTNAARQAAYRTRNAE